MLTDERTRRDLMTALDRLRDLRPEWRLGQTLANLAVAAGRLDAGGVWDLEDKEALEAARLLIEQHSPALPDVDACAAPTPARR